ncbi:hypothetical protein PQC07_gp081 [Aeromonas phage D3]|uniref:Uncharacterized protein n=1 Tax=Aeromonas phage D3 TaxID=2593327 RepID=A0A514TV87_9CAUD|nr:hypothetical protein PQC07_gp081 [Aeromonas phage D3]QDJ96924.1 hypothetical protein D3_0194 [Aeromonas phage D3]QEP52230.1 hypothetical protein D9_0023 [Aeromonas phage D9]
MNNKHYYIPEPKTLGVFARALENHLITKLAQDTMGHVNYPAQGKFLNPGAYSSPGLSAMSSKDDTMFRVEEENGYDLVSRYMETMDPNWEGEPYIPPSTRTPRDLLEMKTHGALKRSFQPPKRTKY